MIKSVIIPSPVEEQKRITVICRRCRRDCSCPQLCGICGIALIESRISNEICHICKMQACPNCMMIIVRNFTPAEPTSSAAMFHPLNGRQGFDNADISNKDKLLDAECNPSSEFRLLIEKEA